MVLLLAFQASRYRLPVDYPSTELCAIVLNDVYNKGMLLETLFLLDEMTARTTANGILKKLEKYQGTTFIFYSIRLHNVIIILRLVTAIFFFVIFYYFHRFT